MKNRPVYRRIPADYAHMQDLSTDIKTLPQAFGGYHLLLEKTCDQTILPQQYLLETGKHKQLLKH